MRVYISPNYIGAPAQADNGGIRRVIEAELRHLPQFGVELVTNAREADVIQNHGQMLTYAPGVPIVHTGHGLYWSRQPWEHGYQEVNQQVVESMARAVAHTAPSEWVSRAIRRGGLWYPEVIYHGVDAGDFPVYGEHGNYVLWNKARADYVSNPNDLLTLANYMQGTAFWSTLGRGGANLRVLGNLPHSEMVETVARAGVYLSTARETFGIGILEALACGVPVAGWDWGGNSEIIVPGQTGYLAPPGDYKTLAQCVERCFAERARLGANARADAETRWRWEPRIEQYANLFRRVHESYAQPRPQVSVIVTTYNEDKYLPACLDSVRRQTLTDWECIVVDDANRHEAWKIVEPYVQTDGRFRYVPTPNNFGLPGARNFGFNYATGKFIRHLDADDWLADNALELEAGQLEAQPGQHIVYGHLEVVNEDGSRNKDRSGNFERSGWPPERFDWLAQMAHLNQLPSCVMMRREVLERSGGYRERMRRNEDAEFWCRTTSLGFRAYKFTQAVTYFHRQREDSKGNMEWKREGKEPDWTAWFPWRVGAADYQEAVQTLRRHNGEHPKPLWVPFGAQGQPPAGRKFWHVHDYAYPRVTIMVTVGPGHEPYVQEALDSIWAQSYPDWECFVINDTGKPWGRNLTGFPWAQVINLDGNQGTAAARNAAFPLARGNWVIWMDADDIWLPWLLEVLVAHAERNEGVIFSDAILEQREGNKLVRKLHRFQNFDCDALAANMKYAGTSVLIPRDMAQAVFDKQGGWDTQIPGKEDHDWQIALHSLGYCAYRVPEPLFVYRMWTTTKRETDFAKIDIISTYLDAKWPRYRLEGKPMCGCGNSTTLTSAQPASLMTSSGQFDNRDFALPRGEPTQMVQVEYIGSRAETFSIRSRLMPANSYRFGNNPVHKVKTVFWADAEFLLSLLEGERPQFRVVTDGARMENRDPAALGMGVLKAEG